MRLTVNLASRPFADLAPTLRKLRIGMGILAGVAILLGIALHLLGSSAAAARAREARIDNSLIGLNHEQQGYRAMMAQPANATVLNESEELNRLIDEKSFSWTLAMEDLERVLPAGVQVTTLEPNRDKKTGEISVRLRVVGPRDKAVELVHNLEHSRHFLQPRIVAETAESAANNAANQQVEPVSPSSRVNFDVVADYNPVTSLDRQEQETKESEKVSADPDEDGTAKATRASYKGEGRLARRPGGAR
jgi:type IV pilus assembly protein PilN